MTPEEMANRMPLTHFPARAVLDGTSTGQPSWPGWGELKPAASLPGAAEPANKFDRICAEHVFLYAGPACFALTPSAYGDSVAYFGEGLDAELRGHAAPFDTGACKPASMGGRLQPYATHGDEAECLGVIDGHSVPANQWRAKMGEWLGHCYESECARYLQTSENHYADGTPVRTNPPEILENNGSRGRDLHPSCADRRAWTWEIRTKAPVSLRWIKAIHVMPASLETADRRAEELAREHSIPRPTVIVARGRTTSPRALYGDSERVLTLLLRVGP